MSITVQITLRVPVIVELTAKWDAENDCADIESVRLAAFQAPMSPRSLTENLSEGDLADIDEAVRLEALDAIEGK